VPHRSARYASEGADACDCARPARPPRRRDPPP
nr:hypothetical protein [Tanacetum cinerariifolium]